jgi:hypothetical protein
MQAATNLDEMVLLASGGEWRKNVKEKHKVDAKNGWYRYKTEFAIPVLNAEKKLSHHVIYGGVLLIRNDADGKSYLYDLIDLEKKKVISSSSSATVRKPDVFEPKPSNKSILQSEEKSNSEDLQKGKTKFSISMNNKGERISEAQDANSVHHSLKGMGELERQVTALEREKESLRERMAYWKGQTKRTKQVTTDKKSVEKAAKALAKEYGARVDTEEVAGALQSLYDYMASGKDGDSELTYTEVRQRAEAIAETLVENSVSEGELYQKYEGLRAYMKAQPLQISKADQANITDFSDFRRRARGLKLRTGETNIDQVYQELAMQWPEFFDEQRETHPSDQLMQIAEVMRTIYGNREVNRFSSQHDQAVAGVANEIMEIFFDLPQAKKTFADRQAAKLEQAKAHGWEQTRKVRAAKNEQIEKLREENRARVKQALKKERNRRETEIETLKEKYRETNRERREQQKARELRCTRRKPRPKQRKKRPPKLAER